MHKTDRLTSPRALFFWPAFMFLLFVPSMIWIWLDHSVQPWDQAWYGEVSVNLYQSFHTSLPEWAHQLFTALPNRAPGLVWLGEFFLPLGILTGRADFGLLVCSWTLQLTSCCLVFRSAYVLFDSMTAAATAAVFTCSAPLFIGMTHTYFTEPMQGLGIALFMYFLIGADRRTLPRTALLLGLAFILASFGKISSALYLICPIALYFVLVYRRGWRQLTDVRRADIPLVVLLAGAAAAFLLWLGLNYSGVMAHAALASSGSAASYYGSRSGLFQKIPLWTRLALVSFSHPIIRPFILVFAVAAVWRRMKTRLRAGWQDEIVSTCLLSIVLTLLTFCLNVSEDSRFAFPLFPFFAIVIGGIAASLDRWGKRIVWLAAMGQFVLVYGQAFAFAPLNSESSPYLKAVDASGSQLAELRQALNATCEPGVSSRLFIVGMELPYFNANSFSFYSAVNGLTGGIRCAYASLGYAESDPRLAWSSVVNRHPGGILFLKDELARISPSDPLNRVSASVAERAGDSTVFRRSTIAQDPNLLLFATSEGWRIRSALFREQASTWTSADGSFGWHIHPALRSGAIRTVLEFDGGLPANATVAGHIASCDARCLGVEIDLETTSPNHAVREHRIRLPGPLIGKDFSVDFENQADDTLSVHVMSVDAEHDNIDYCWLTVDGVNIRAAGK
jgi:4-amino-4-deoxy-L-arabinose transferase-like glycosyltransferase